MTTTTEIPPAIRHWLDKRTICTVHWITQDGQEHHVLAPTKGWGRTPNGTPMLVLGTKPKPTHVPAAALQRWLDRQTVATRPALPATERCQDCGKPLGTGPNGHMDEHASAPGYCYDCV
jgi:hypothetical protein